MTGRSTGFLKDKVVRIYMEGKSYMTIFIWRGFDGESSMRRHIFARIRQWLTQGESLRTYFHFWNTEHLHQSIK